MAVWSASLDPASPETVVDGILYATPENPREERPNWAGYYTFTSDDGRAIPDRSIPGKQNAPGVRVPFNPQDDGADGRPLQPHNFLAKECDRLAAVDQRMADMAVAMASRAADFPNGAVSLPDLSKQKALAAAQVVFDQKVAAVLIQSGTRFTKEQVADAIAADPTVADAKAALEAAQADAAKIAGP